MGGVTGHRVPDEDGSLAVTCLMGRLRRRWDEGRVDLGAGVVTGGGMWSRRWDEETTAGCGAREGWLCVRVTYGPGVGLGIENGS
jgi:hypothetical protein